MIYIPFDRSRRELDEKCPRARYFGYEFDTPHPSLVRGIESIKLNKDMLLGGAFHDVMAEVMGEVQETDAPPTPGLLAAAVQSSTARLRQAVHQRGLDFRQDTPMEFVEDPYTGDLPIPQPEGLDWLVDHYATLVEALARGWVRAKLPDLLATYRVLEVEEEKQYLIPVDARHTLAFLSRVDVHLQRRTDGAHVLLNFKTAKEIKQWWLDQWQIDQQTISEALPIEYETGQPIAGVLIEGVVKGREYTEWPKGSGHKHHSSPLVWLWKKDADGFEPEEWSSRHNWQEDGRNRRLGKGWYLAPATEYPGGIPAWLDWLETNDPELLDQQFPSPPLVTRQGSEIQDWLKQTTLREFLIYQHRQLVDEQGSDLAQMFPKHTHNANCLFPKRCPFYDCCWGTAADDPLGSGLYQIRHANHPGEIEHDLLQATQGS